MKRSPIKRRTYFRSTGKFKMRTRRIRARNAKRRKSEFARCYGSRKRVAWVKAQPCVVCIAIHPFFGVGTHRSDNAHTATGGMGRKAGYETIVPLCRSHHQRYDDHQHPCDTPDVRAYIASCAPMVEEAWQRHQAGHV